MKLNSMFYDLPLFFVLSCFLISELKKLTGFLMDNFGDRIIKYGDNVEWPQKSSVPTPFDFFFWGYMKTQIDSFPNIYIVPRISYKSQLWNSNKEKTNVVNANTLCVTFIEYVLQMYCIFIHIKCT